VPKMQHFTQLYQRDSATDLILRSGPAGVCCSVELEP
jgi:hypothetical protein